MIVHVIPQHRQVERQATRIWINREQSERSVNLGMGDLFFEPAAVGTLDVKPQTKTTGVEFHVVKLGATEKESSWEVLAEWAILPLANQSGSQQCMWWTSYIIIGRAGTLGDKLTGVYESWDEFVENPSPSRIIMTPKESGIVYHVNRGVATGDVAVVDMFRPAGKVPVGSDVYACLVVCGPSGWYYQVHGQGRRMVRRAE